MTRRGTRLQRRLPAPLDAIVGQIETEIGELFGSDAEGDVLANGAEDGSHPAATAAISASGLAPHEPGENGRVESAVRDILTEIGEDPQREGLRATPERVHRMYRELLAGYHVDPERLLNNAIFEVEYSEMVVVKGIEFYSLCEHHLLPFYGHAAVAYIPRGRVVGLSKIPRIVEMFARRLQVQERMTQEIADFVQERLDPKGVGVVIEATHLCMVMRGVRKEAVVTTAALHGLMQSRDRTRAEFLAHLERGA
jgi:GTP cyclohydrolase I